MTAPLRSYDTNFGRFYSHPSVAPKPASRWPDESEEVETPYSPKPSITNIMKMLDEAFLPGYHSKLVAEYAVDNIDQLADWLHEHPDGRQTLISELKAVPLEPHPNAAIGDEVHNAIDRDIKGEETGPPLSTITAKRMFAQWLHFKAVRKPRIIQSEFTVWSYEYGYAGTGDLLWEDEDGVWIVDTKTGNRIYPKVAMQTAAAQHADVILDGDGNEHSMVKAGNLGVLHIRPMSAKLYKIEHADEAWGAFLACKRLFDWTRYCKESSIGGVMANTAADVKGLR